MIEQLGVGGAETQLLGLVRRMDPARFQQAVCYFYQSPDSLDPEFRAAGLETYRLHKSRVSTVRFFMQLRRVIREFRPDVVHTWLYVANFWGRWAAICARVPLVIASDRAEAGSPHRLIDIISERLSLRRTCRLANSGAVADSMVRWYRIPRDRIGVIYNGVNTESLPACGEARRSVREELGVAPDAKLVLMVARLWPVKNWPMFVRAGAEVCKRRPDTYFLAAGMGPLEPELRDLASNLGAGDHIRFLGLRADVSRLLAAADAFCFTSWNEGFPNALLEAMGAGLPVVSAAFPAAREVIDRDCGILVPVNDHTALAREVDALLGDTARRQELGARARDRVVTRFSWEVLVREMERLYLSVRRPSSNPKEPGPPADPTECLAGKAPGGPSA